MGIREEICNLVGRDSHERLKKEDLVAALAMADINILSAEFDAETQGGAVVYEYKWRYSDDAGRNTRWSRSVFIWTRESLRAEFGWITGGGDYSCTYRTDELVLFGVIREVSNTRNILSGAMGASRYGRI